MTIEELKVILNRIGVSTERLREKKKGQIQICCPLAKWNHQKGTDNSPSMGIHYGVDCETVFRCFSCKASGRIWKLVFDIGSLKEDQELLALADKLLEEDRTNLKTLLDAAFIDIDPWFEPATKHEKTVVFPARLNMFVSVEESEPATEYLKSRKIDIRIARRYNVRYDVLKERLVFPGYDSKGNILVIQGRYIGLKTDEPKYYVYWNLEKANCLGGIQYVRKESKYIQVVEGWMGILNLADKAAKQDADVVCTFGASLSNEQANQIILLDKQVDILYDNDSAGNNGAYQAKALLQDKVFNVKVVKFPEKYDSGNIPETDYVQLIAQTRKGI